ncbi:MAG: AMP-binding protein, partial [Actinobacteria bacterium]|nr:AMP-binding protein [Actinomycetota bacterium]
MATSKRKTAKKTARKTAKKSAKKSARKLVKKKSTRKVVKKKSVKKSARKLVKKKSTRKLVKKSTRKAAKKSTHNPLNAIKDVGAIVRYHAKNQPDAVSLVLGDRTLTWAQLLSRSAQVAQGLKRAGVKAQDRVAFLDKNGIEHFEVFYGCALLNAVSVDVNWRLAAPEVSFIVNDSQAEVLIVGQEFVPVLDAIVGELDRVKTIIVIGGHSNHDDYEQWVNAQSATDPKAPTKSTDVAFQLYSSGTTGRPKGVMLTNDNFFAL